MEVAMLEAVLKLNKDRMRRRSGMRLKQERETLDIKLWFEKKRWGSKVTPRLRTEASDSGSSEIRVIGRVYWKVMNLIGLGRQVYRSINSVLDGFKQRRLDDIHWVIWLPQWVTVRLRWVKRLRRSIWRVACHPHRDVGQSKRTLFDGLMMWCIERKGVDPRMSLAGFHRRVVRVPIRD